MAGIVTTAADVRMLGGAVGVGLRLKLFANDRVPAKGDTLADYTEPSGGGYADIALDPSGWSTVPTVPAYSTHPLRTFAFTGAAGTMYGYLIADDGGTLLVIERFAEPLEIARPGDKIEVTPKITQRP